LADVLAKDVDGGAVPADERFESAARFDGVELVMVPDDHGLGAGHVGGGEQLQHRLVVGHAFFVDQEDGALIEPEPLVLERFGEGPPVPSRTTMTHPTPLFVGTWWARRAIRRRSRPKRNLVTRTFVVETMV
jgi:hypothetical protein